MNLDDLEYLSIGAQMRRIYEKLQVMADKVYSDMGLNFKASWFPIYYTLLQSKRALTITELTKNISYSRITVKNVARELGKAGLVKISANPTDSRSKLVQLTERGRQIESDLQSIWEIFQTKLEFIFGNDDKEFLKRLAEINGKLNKQPLEREILREHYKYTVRNAKPKEFNEIGELMVTVYAALKGFPKPDVQPEYYNLLRMVGQLTKKKNTELLVAVSKQGHIDGAVVFFNDMKDYGSGGTATLEKNACGFRLLAVEPKSRGLGLGKLLTEYCLEKGRESDCKNMVIHTTKSMKVAWSMYERLGFKRAEDLDFMQGNLPVFGFRLKLTE